MIVSQLQVAQVDALKGRQQRHRRRGGASDLDDACGCALHGLVGFLLRGPHLTERGVPLRQVVGAGVANAYLSIEEDRELVGQIRGGGAGDRPRSSQRAR